MAIACTTNGGLAFFGMTSPGGGNHAVVDVVEDDVDTKTAPAFATSSNAPDALGANAAGADPGTAATASAMSIAGDARGADAADDDADTAAAAAAEARSSTRPPTVSWYQAGYTGGGGGGGNGKTMPLPARPRLDVRDP